MQWFQEATSHNLPISGPILEEKAKKLATALEKPDFRVTNGWMWRWKARNGIVYKRYHGESQSADTTSAGVWKDDVTQQLLQSFEPCNIYNADETGLCYRATPTVPLLSKSAKSKGVRKLWNA